VNNIPLANFLQPNLCAFVSVDPQRVTIADNFVCDAICPAVFGCTAVVLALTTPFFIKFSVPTFPEALKLCAGAMTIPTISPKKQSKLDPDNANIRR